MSTNYVFIENKEDTYFNDCMKKYDLGKQKSIITDIDVILPFLEKGDNIILKRLTNLTGDTSVAHIFNAMGEIVDSGCNLFVCENDIVIKHDDYEGMSKFTDLFADINNQILRIRSRTAAKEGKKPGRPYGTHRSPLDRVRGQIEDMFIDKDMRVADIAEVLNANYAILYNYMRTRGILQKKKETQSN